MTQGGPILAAGRVRSKKYKNRKSQNTKMPPQPKHTTKSTAPRRPRTPRDGARRNTFHALAHLARFYRSRVCGNRLSTALAISKNDECYTYTHRQTNGTVYAPRYDEAFLPTGKKRPRSLRSLGLVS